MNKNPTIIKNIFLIFLLFTTCSCSNKYEADAHKNEKFKVDSNDETSDFQQANDYKNHFESCIVEYVVDGDTVEVSTENDIIRVRIIGVDTPESVNQDESKNCYEGKVASDFTKEMLYSGREIFLEYDVEKNDIYGRTLAYIWLNNEVDTNSFEDFKLFNFGAILLQNTYCRAVYYEPNGKYKLWNERLDQDNFPY